jgi:hypothetical protein
MSPVPRRPWWSGALTGPLARRIPAQARPQVLAGIKATHTVLFFSIAAAIVLFTWDGLRGRPGRRTAIAAGIALGETAIYASNNQVCPLTPLAEELGAQRGSVVDIYLPDWASRRIPLVGGGALLLGLALNARALRPGFLQHRGRSSS